MNSIHVQFIHIIIPRCWLFHLWRFLRCYRSICAVARSCELFLFYPLQSPSSWVWQSGHSGGSEPCVPWWSYIPRDNIFSALLYVSPGQDSQLPALVVLGQVPQTGYPAATWKYFKSASTYGKSYALNTPRVASSWMLSGSSGSLGQGYTFSRSGLSDMRHSLDPYVSLHPVSNGFILLS